MLARRPTRWTRRGGSPADKWSGLQDHNGLRGHIGGGVRRGGPTAPGGKELGADPLLVFFWRGMDQQQPTRNELAKLVLSDQPDMVKVSFFCLQSGKILRIKRRLSSGPQPIGPSIFDRTDVLHPVEILLRVNIASMTIPAIVRQACR